MKIVTYLGFTLLSVFIQFSVVDFIQGMLKLDDKQINNQGTSQKKQLRDILTNISYKPHAIYYRTPKSKAIKNHSPAKLFSNITLIELFATTEISTTIFDVLYDENHTTTDEIMTTTESLYTSTEVENMTEVTIFEKTNETTLKPEIVPKKTLNDCNCDIMFKVCDVNCCCDADCMESEIELFPHCFNNESTIKENDGCISQLPYLGHGHGLFCIVKINLPEKRNKVIQKGHQATIEHYLTWKSSKRSLVLYEFSNKVYKQGDPIWLLNNGSFYHTDLPAPKINNYCTGRKAIKFLKDEEYSCIVRIKDLEMFQIIDSLDATAVISATLLSMNSSVLNCTMLHCVNWTILACNNLHCSNYNKTLHEPQCTEIMCTNLALKIDYIFNYHDSKIINATIKFHVHNVTMDLTYMSQEIKVRFILANKSIDNILQLSGNPGYLHDLPIIVSYANNNYTSSFYNNSMKTKYLLLPGSHNGVCVPANISRNYVLFGRNRRIKCRYYHKTVKLGNTTNECTIIQNTIKNMLGLYNNGLVSPLGNPQRLKDEDWLTIDKIALNKIIYGDFQEKTSKLLCYNLVTRYSIVITYANISGNRLLSCNFQPTLKNVRLNKEDISIIVTIDVSFIDVTKPTVVENAIGSPNLHMHLPDDFFYPFRSNESRTNYNVFTLILCATFCLQIK